MTHMNAYYIPFDLTTVYGTHSNMSRFPKMVIEFQVAEFLTCYMLLLVGTMLRCTNLHLKQYIQSISNRTLSAHSNLWQYIKGGSKQK